MIRYQQRGFTLIELMIAIALGMLIMLIAMAAFRSASQSIAIANRLALENSIMCAGMQIGHDNLDFWTDLDDPNDPTRQGLRASTTVRGYPVVKGGPFTEFSAYWPGTFNDTDTPMGFDPRDTSWAMGNPRMWWRANMAEKNDSGLMWGRYGVFSNSAKTLSAFAQVPILVPQVDANGNPILDANGDPTFSSVNIGYGQVEVPHCWLASQMRGISSLGFYGYIDYLPPNALYSWYDPNSGSTTKGGYWKEFIGPGGQFNTMYQKTPKGMMRLSTLNTCFVPDPRVKTTVSDMTNWARRTFNTSDYGGRVGSVWGAPDSRGSLTDNLMDVTSKGINFIDSGVTAPETWPSLTVKVHRFYQHAFAVNLVRVKISDPFTGEAKELSFAGFGTSLRGARQQRKSGGGWAKWDNASLAQNDRNLDY